MRVITLYNNRKYYDKGLKGYVTLLDILQAVKDGDDFVVLNKAGRNVTTKAVNAAIYKHVEIPFELAKDLVQQLYEVEKEKMFSLPKENAYDRL